MKECSILATSLHMPAEMWFDNLEDLGILEPQHRHAGGSFISISRDSSTRGDRIIGDRLGKGIDAPTVAAEDAIVPRAGQYVTAQRLPHIHDLEVSDVQREVSEEVVEGVLRAED